MTGMHASSTTAIHTAINSTMHNITAHITMCGINFVQQKQKQHSATPQQAHLERSALRYN